MMLDMNGTLANDSATGQLVSSTYGAQEVTAMVSHDMVQHEEDGDDADTWNSMMANMSIEQWFNSTCELLEVPQDVIKTVIEPTVTCVGICGILLTLLVLTRKCMLNSCNCYLLAMAIGDLVFLFIMLARFMVYRLIDCQRMTGGEIAVMDLYTSIVMDICQYLTVCVTVMLTLERYIAICHPMRAMGVCTVKRARVIILMLAVAVTILLCPKFLDIQTTRAKTKTQETILVVTYDYKYDQQLYTYIVTVSLLTFVPLVTLLVLNGRIIYEIQRSSRYLQNYLGVDWRVRSIVSSEELKITMMLVSVVVAFFACHAPYLVFICVMAVKNFDTEHHSELNSSETLTYFRHLCHSLLALKSCCNFVLYCWFSDKFWTTFKRICDPKTCRNKKTAYRHGSCNNGHHCRFSSRTHPLRSSDYISKETTC